MAGCLLFQRRVYLTAGCNGDGAARVKMAAPWWINWRRHIARKDDTLAFGFSYRVRDGHCG